MKKTIQQVSQQLDMPVLTIRYYDKEGLLPYHPSLNLILKYLFLNL